MTLVYSAGLRVSEAIGLRVSDILSDQGQIRVRGGKGKKDRYTTLAYKTISILREYYRVYKTALKKLSYRGERSTPSGMLREERREKPKTKFRNSCQNLSKVPKS